MADGPKVIRVMGFANGVPCPFAGEFVQDMDFEAGDGRGFLRHTPDPAKAKRFPDLQHVWDFLHTQPKCRPLREDGKPNKPMFASHNLIEDAP